MKPSMMPQRTIIPQLIVKALLENKKGTLANNVSSQSVYESFGVRP